jgi:threonine dehydrogenase-like Zn-dependent dehydrogenase
MMNALKNPLTNIAANLADRILQKRETETPIQPNVDNSKKMGAMVWEGPDKVKYDWVPKPVITDSKDIILKVNLTAICGTDLHMYTGKFPAVRAGSIMGHEFVGIIEDVGSEVRTLRVGQRVVCSYNISCGKCEFCQREEYTGCKVTNPSNLEKATFGIRTCATFGYSQVTGGVPGGQAQFVRVPFAEVNCLPLPDNIPDEKALFLSDVATTSYWGTEMGEGMKMKPGSTVAIWGLGPIGLMVARWCQIRGASRIIGIDYVRERLELARDILKIETINFKTTSVIPEIIRMFPDGVDIGIECAGFRYSNSIVHQVEKAVMLESDSADILTEIFTCVRAFGHVAILGIYIGLSNHFPTGAMIMKGLQVRSGPSPTQKFWNIALDKIKSGELDPTFVITNRITLDKAPEFYKKFHKKKDGVIKVIMVPPCDVRT